MTVMSRHIPEGNSPEFHLHRCDNIKYNVRSSHRHHIGANLENLVMIICNSSSCIV